MSPRISIRLLQSQSDERLVELVREGHERAFDALVHRYSRPLLRYCRRMGLSGPLAEDVLQQALLKAWLALVGGAEVRELRPWLYRVIHNTALNAVRTSAARPAELTDAAHLPATVSPGGELDPGIAARDALAGLAALPRLQREAMLLTAIEGRTHEEASGALGVSHSAVRGLLYRARATLRDAAAAFTPQPVMAWASGGGGTASVAERLAEQSAGGVGVGDARRVHGRRGLHRSLRRGASSPCARWASESLSPDPGSRRLELGRIFGAGAGAAPLVHGSRAASGGWRASTYRRRCRLGSLAAIRPPDYPGGRARSHLIRDRRRRWAAREFRPGPTPVRWRVRRGRRRSIRGTAGGRRA